MNILLDTHAFLWFVNGDSNLTETARGLIEDLENQRFLSFEVLVQREVYGNAISLLAIQPSHLDVLTKLPFHHKDPFDRLIIAQGLTEKMSIITKDDFFDSYSVVRLW